jgi:hypothetical protein
MLTYSVFLISVKAASFTKVGTHGGTTLQINNIGSGAFDPTKLKNWHSDVRHPLINPNAGGTCPGQLGVIGVIATRILKGYIC